VKKLIALLAFLACLAWPSAASAQTTAVFGTGVQDGTGAIMGSGTWCFASNCLSVSSGAFSGTVTSGTQTVTVVNASSVTVLTIPNVYIPSGSAFNWNSYVVTPNAQISGVGQPYQPSWVGSTYTGTSPTQTLYGQSYSGQVAWGPVQSPASSGLTTGYGAPTFACVSPCLFTRIDTQTAYIVIGPIGAASSTWASQGGLAAGCTSAVVSSLGTLTCTGTGTFGTLAVTDQHDSLNNLLLPYYSGMPVPPANAATNNAQTAVIATAGVTTQYSFGDSITAGTGATLCTQPGGTCYVDVLNTAVGSPTLHNYGVGGAQMCDTSILMFNDINLGASSTALVTLMDGTNDAYNDGLTGYALGPMTDCQNSMITWATVPSTLKTLPASLSLASNWSLGTYGGLAVAESTTNAAAQQWPYTITQTGQTLVIWVAMVDGNAGCFSVFDSFDTNNILYGCSYSATPIATLNGGAAGVKAIYYVDTISGRTPGSYYLTITPTTTTGAGNIVAIAGIGVLPPAGTGNNLWEGGVPRQWLDGSGKTTKYFDQVVRNNVAFNYGLGLPVNFVDVRNNWLATTSEMSTGGNQQLHPNNLGHSEIAAAFQAPTAAQTYVPNSSVTPCTGPWRLVTTTTDNLSLTDTNVIYNSASGVVVTLPANASPVTLGLVGNTRLNGTTGSIVCVQNWNGTGNVSFVGAPGTTLRDGLASLILYKDATAVLQNNFVTEGNTWWWPVGGYGTSVSLAQGPGSTPIALGTVPLTSSYISYITGSVPGMIYWANTSSGNWTPSEVLWSALSWEFLKCTAVTSISTTNPAGCVQSYLFDFSGNNFTNGIGETHTQDIFRSGTGPTIVTPNTGGLTVREAVDFPSHLTAPTTIAAATFTTTGIVMQSLPASVPWHFHCSIAWAQSTAVATAQFGLGVANAVTDVFVQPPTIWNGTTFTVGSSTTFTGPGVTAVTPSITPAATATEYKVELDGVVANGTQDGEVMTLYGLTSNTSDALVVEPGSYCSWLP
jgi:lysophospholipase L1-like esterase